MQEQEQLAALAPSSGASRHLLPQAGEGLGWCPWALGATAKTRDCSRSYSRLRGSGKAVRRTQHRVPVFWFESRVTLFRVDRRFALRPGLFLVSDVPVGADYLFKAVIT